MNGKRRRHEAIRSIIDSDAGSTQEEIKALLEKRGINISQSTLSRDLREMGAVKVPVEGRRTVYRLNDSEHQSYHGGSMIQAMEEFCTGYDQVGNFMIIKSKPGNARDLCLVLDRQSWKEIIGTLAGDDTILVIARTSTDIKAIMEKLK